MGQLWSAFVAKKSLSIRESFLSVTMTKMLPVKSKIIFLMDSSILFGIPKKQFKMVILLVSFVLLKWE